MAKYYSRAKSREYAQKMNEIQNFCDANGIQASRSLDSFYFTINGINYRVSNHTISASNRGMYDPLTGEKKRSAYHDSSDDIVCITASKTRIAEIYNNLKVGKTLDKRGFVKELL